MIFKGYNRTLLPQEKKMNRVKNRILAYKFNRLRKQGLDNMVEIFDTIKYIESLPS
jgi:hypothetical protein